MVARADCEPRVARAGEGPQRLGEIIPQVLARWHVAAAVDNGMEEHTVEEHTVEEHTVEEHAARPPALLFLFDCESAQLAAVDVATFVVK